MADVHCFRCGKDAPGLDRAPIPGPVGQFVLVKTCAACWNVFRFRWNDSANRLFYLGAGEGSDFQYEVVRILDPENDEVNVYFDRVGKMPAKIEYRSVDKQGVRYRHVEEYSQWHVIQGVKTPLRIDSFVNGRKSSQQFVLKIAYNNNLTDDFFVKPIPPK